MKSHFYCHECMTDRPSSEFGYLISGRSMCKKHPQKSVAKRIEQRKSDALAKEKPKRTQTEADSIMREKRDRMADIIQQREVEAASGEVWE